MLKTLAWNRRQLPQLARPMTALSTHPGGGGPSSFESYFVYTLPS